MENSWGMEIKYNYKIKRVMMKGLGDTLLLSNINLYTYTYSILFMCTFYISSDLMRL